MNEWISVEEQLPPRDIEGSSAYEVLVFVPQREGCHQHGIYIGRLRKVAADDGSKNFWGIPREASDWSISGWSYFEHPIVTHWTLLPMPPTKNDW